MNNGQVFYAWPISILSEVQRINKKSNNYA